MQSRIADIFIVTTMKYIYMIFVPEGILHNMYIGLD